MIDMGVGLVYYWFEIDIDYVWSLLVMSEMLIVMSCMLLLNLILGIWVWCVYVVDCVGNVSVVV